MKKLKKIIASMILFFLFVPYIGATESLPSIKEKSIAVPPKTGQTELVDERTATSKTYLKSDGSKQLISYQMPVNYEKIEDGVKKFYEIDPNLTEERVFGVPSSNEYKNASNNFSLKINKKLTDKAFSLSKDDTDISVDLSNVSSSNKDTNIGFDDKTVAKVSSTKKDNKVIYENIVPDTDITFYSMPDGVKEYITLDKYNGQNVFEFSINVKNINILKQENESFSFINKASGKEVFSMPKFFMWDSKGGNESEENQYNYELTTELIQINSDEYLLKVVAPNEWLSDASRVFPVVIDPSFTQNSAEDTYIQSGYSTTRAWNQGALWVGKGSTKGYMRTLTKFDLPDLSRARINSSRFEVLQYGNCSGVCTWAGVNAWTTGWYNPWDVAWFNQPWHTVNWVGSGHNTSTWDWMKIDTTNAVNLWYNWGNPQGTWAGSLAFTQDAESYWGFRTWASRNHPDYWWGQPKMVIDYNDYNAIYNPTAIGEGIAGTTVDVPVGLVNTGRNTWYKGGANPTKLGYHLVNNATGEEIVWDGGWNEIPYDIGGGGSGTAIAKVKLPPVSGSYTIKFDVVHSGITWFSHQGIATANQVINVYPPSMSSMNHMGQESYYTMAGPIDLASGNLAYSSTDLSVNSNLGGLSFARSYNSNQALSTFKHDASGYIRSWLVNGPYKNNDQVTRLSNPYIASEEGLRPNSFSSSNNNVWLPASEPTTSNMQLDWVFEGTGAYQRGRAINVAAYSHVYVYSPVARAAQLRLGSDDGIKAWLNGDLVNNSDVYRGLVFDQDVRQVNLKAGWNSLLTKTSQGGGGWNMAARFTDLAGVVMNDMEYSLNNPELYSSKGILGQGWVSNIDESLLTVNPNDIYYRDATGSVNQYVFNGTKYLTPPGTDFTLNKTLENYTLTNNEGYKKVFSLAGKLLEIKDLASKSVKYNYDISGKVSSLTDSGRSLILNYNFDGTLASVSNEVGQSIVYNYENGRLSRVIDNDGYSYKYSYNSDGRLTEYQDKKNNATRFEYLGSKVVKATDALGGVTTVNYLPGKTEVIDAKGRKNVYGFDGANMLSMSTNAKNYSEKYIYDKRYNRVQMMPNFSVSDADYYVYKYIYDASDNLVSETDPLDAVTRYTYQGNDLARITDPKGNFTENTYSADGLRLLISAKDAEGNATRYEYDNLGRRTATISPKGEKTTTSYNVFGDVVSVSSPSGETTSFVYDLVGRKIKDVSPMGKENFYTYDSLSRLSKVTAPGDLATEYQFDPNSNKLKEINPNSTYKTWVYDALNRIVVQRDEAGAETRYEYDAIGNKIRQIDAKGKATAYEYDELNQLVKETDVTGVSSTVGYNKNGEMLAVTDAKGQVSTQTLDKSGQAKTETKPEGVSSLTYDANGNVTTLTAPKESVSISYNKNGDVLTESSTQTGLVTRAYDTNQGQTSVQVGSAKTDFVYDQNGVVSEVKPTIQGVSSPTVVPVSTNPTVSIPTTAGASSFARDAEGKISTIAKANGDIVSLTYDISGRVSNVSTRNKDGVLIAGHDYQYDKASNQTQVSDNKGRITNYSYDARSQLLSDDRASYSYDIVGNRKEMQTANGMVRYYYDDDKHGNRLTKAEYPDGRMVLYEYDKNGNATKKTDSQKGTTTYRYDSDDYFVEAVLSDGTKVEYTYDEVSKRRTQRKITKPNGAIEITKFNFDGDKLMSEMDASGKVLRSYTWDENENLLSVAMPDASGVLKYYYFVKNAKGDIVGLTDGSGKLVAEYEYDSWGNIQKAETLDLSLGANFAKTNPRLYASYWYDDVLGQYFMKTRMYDPEIGRFYSQDPLEDEEEILSQNPYIYCSNNPIDRVDPDGKFWKKIGSFAKKTGNFLATAATGTYNFFIGDDLRTLKDKNASFGSKAIAFGFLSTSFIPVAKVGKLGKVMKFAKVAPVTKKVEKTYVVYASYNDFGKINYVGRTNNLARRQAEWARKGLDVKPLYMTPSKEASRGIEQIMINRSGGVDNLLNKINGISLKNKNYNKYMNAGTDYLKNLK